MGTNNNYVHWSQDIIVLVDYQNNITLILHKFNIKSFIATSCRHKQNITVALTHISYEYFLLQALFIKVALKCVGVSVRIG